MIGPPEYTPQSKRELLELQAVMFLSAPDRFFFMPEYPMAERRTLVSTVADMRRGIDHVYRQPRHAEARRRMHELVDKMFAEFQVHKITEGRATSLDFEDLVRLTRP